MSADAHTPQLQFRDVCFGYDRQEILHNISLTVHAGDLVAVVGPNGGGKSTLLRLGLGLLRPTLGEVRLFGEAPSATSGRVGYVPQQLRFDPRFPVSVLDVVLMGRCERFLMGGYRREDREGALAALARVGIERLARRPFAELSGGERQRVLIAQALACDPELLMLDEPTANVDAPTESVIYELLHELNERITVVVVSHNLNVVTRHASHVACINHTASMVSTEAMTRDQLHEAMREGLAVLHHHDTCHVIDPSKSLATPHRDAAGSDDPR